MVRGPGGWEFAGDVDLRRVRVDLEYDPRLHSPQNSSAIWANLTEKARKIADAVFKAEHPKAQVIPERAVHSE